MTSFFVCRCKQSSVFMRINCNFVTTVGLTNDERCLIRNLRVKKHCRGCERITRIFSNKWAHLNREYLIANVKIVQDSINVRCYAVCLAIYWRSWKECHFFGSPCRLYHTSAWYCTCYIVIFWAPVTLVLQILLNACNLAVKNKVF